MLLQRQRMGSDGSFTCHGLGSIIVWHVGYAQARKLETELDSKLAAYGKLAAGYDSSYAAKGESGLAAEQARSQLPYCLCTTPISPFVPLLHRALL